MSATNRGAARDPLDRYDTPAWCVDRLLDRIGATMATDHWLEPCVGSGAIVHAANAWLAARGDTPPLWWLSDIEPRCTLPWSIRAADFLTIEPERLPAALTDLAITNPPYKHALAFARRLTEVADVTAMLLRVNWLEGSPSEEPERYHFLRANPPSVFVLPQRPAFTRDGQPLVGKDGKPRKGSDATAYAWIVWGLGGGTWELLDVTAKAERRPTPRAPLSP